MAVQNMLPRTFRLANLGKTGDHGSTLAFRPPCSALRLPVYSMSPSRVKRRKKPTVFSLSKSIFLDRKYELTLSWLPCSQMSRSQLNCSQLSRLLSAALLSCHVFSCHTLRGETLSCHVRGHKQLSFPLSCSQLSCLVVTVSAPSLNSHVLSCRAVKYSKQGAGPLPPSSTITKTGIGERYSQ